MVLSLCFLEDRSRERSRSRWRVSRSRSRYSKSRSISSSNDDIRRSRSRSASTDSRDSRGSKNEALTSILNKKDENCFEPPNVVLDENVLGALGDRIIEQRKLSAAVHSDVAVRWSDIVVMGISEDEKTKLLEKYPLPELCVDRPSHFKPRD